MSRRCEGTSSAPDYQLCKKTEKLALPFSCRYRLAAVSGPADTRAQKSAHIDTRSMSRRDDFSLTDPISYLNDVNGDVERALRGF